MCIFVGLYFSLTELLINILTYLLSPWCLLRNLLASAMLEIMFTFQYEQDECYRGSMLNHCYTFQNLAPTE